MRTLRSMRQRRPVRFAPVRSRLAVCRAEALPPCLLLRDLPAPATAPLLLSARRTSVRPVRIPSRRFDRQSRELRRGQTRQSENRPSPASAAWRRPAIFRRGSATVSASRLPARLRTAVRAYLGDSYRPPIPSRPQLNIRNLINHSPPYQFQQGRSPASFLILILRCRGYPWPWRRQRSIRSEEHTS